MGMYGQEPKSGAIVRKLLQEALFEVDNFAHCTWQDAKRIEHDAWDDLTAEPTIENAKTLANLRGFERDTYHRMDEITQLANRLRHEFSLMTQVAEGIDMHDEEREQAKNGTLATPLAE